MTGDATSVFLSLKGVEAKQASVASCYAAALCIEQDKVAPLQGHHMATPYLFRVTCSGLGHIVKYSFSHLRDQGGSSPATYVLPALQYKGNRHGA
uniref:Uncharacterized protein n=1 Tax=Erwinia amylovora ATCC BAA-2158 TaxID=889211 RepID=E5B638_ERWAM|nr:hypothetical protein predicted by Glimmer/Critica [Erwinia amylovora ATCC BAA-2158]